MKDPFLQLKTVATQGKLVSQTGSLRRNLVCSAKTAEFQAVTGKFTFF
jgi:hypothetical protein